ncbi:serine hydrolase, partial [Streptomyces pharetrae]
MSALGWIAAAGLTALLGVTAPGPSPPPPQPPPQLDDAEVRRAVDRLDGVVESAMRRTGAPGVAVAVVHD